MQITDIDIAHEQLGNGAPLPPLTGMGGVGRGWWQPGRPARRGELSEPRDLGDEDICTPPHASEKLAMPIPGSHLDTVQGGHVIYRERPDEPTNAVSTFVPASTSPPPTQRSICAC